MGGTPLYQYSPASDTWTKKADLPILALENAVIFSIGSKAYVGTGFGVIHEGFFEPTNQFWEYDSETDKWTRKADFAGVSRFGAAGFSIGSKGYIGTGATTADRQERNAVCDFWEYNPGTDKWTLKSAFKGGVRHGSFGASVNGKGFIGLGFGTTNNVPFKNDLWEFDPSL
ncbi:MAG: type sorting protein [Daejeonella sp.]|nr:type sorting protein [Daejeonella sp.]